jgi:hypothetical protein
MCEPWNKSSQKSTRRTLIVARRVSTEVKIALMGVILEVFSASFKASMAAFNAEIAPLCSFGRRYFASIVETRGSWEKT